jgi:3-oxoacyl-[acyl-carrier-protein] synthase III
MTVPAGRPGDPRVGLRQVFLAGLSSFSPGEPIPFDDIETVLGKITDAPKKIMRRIERMRSLMKQMLGIEYSHYAMDPITRQVTETNTSMAAKAARKALNAAGIDAEDIELIVHAGILYDYLCPPTSTLIQEALSIPYCAEIAIHSNCTAVYKALQVASDLIAAGRYDNALVVTSQLSSPFLRAEYFNQSVITEEQVILRWFLSDGAGALVLTSERPGSPALRVLDTYLESVGMNVEPSMWMNVGACHWNTREIYETGGHHLTQDLKTVARLAPELGAKGFVKMLDRWQRDLSKVKCCFVNIPTKHMMDLAAAELERLTNNANIPIYTKLSTRGYPGAPAIVIALDGYLSETRLERGDQLLSFVTESSKWMHAGFVLDYD